MNVADVGQLLGPIALVLASAAFWSYWRDRRKARAEGDVATATVEIQVEAKRVANLEQRFAFAQAAWDEERESLQRLRAEDRDAMQKRIDHCEDLLEKERRERAEEEQQAQEQIKLLEARLRGVQREVSELTDQITALRRVRERKDPE